MERTIENSAPSEAERREAKASLRVSATALLLSMNALLVAMVSGAISSALPSTVALASVALFPAAFASLAAYRHYSGGPRKAPSLPGVRHVPENTLTDNEFSEKMAARAVDLDREKILAKEETSLREAVEETRSSLPGAVSSLSELDRIGHELKEIQTSTEARLRGIEEELADIRHRADSLPNELAEDGFPFGVWVRWDSEGVALAEKDGEYVFHSAPWDAVAHETEAGGRRYGVFTPVLAPVIHTNAMGAVLGAWTAATILSYTLLILGVG